MIKSWTRRKNLVDLRASVLTPTPPIRSLVEPINTQGGDMKIGSVLAWHPVLNVLAVATNAAVVEYDAVSGCRRSMVDCDGSPVKLMYTPDGKYLILLTRERNLFAWSTHTWKKEVLLVAEAKYAGRPLVSGMLAVSAHRDSPVVFYSPMGKKTIRTIRMGAQAESMGGKNKEVYRPGFKLKTDNKKVLVGLAADVVDPHKVYVLTVDGEVMACHVGLTDGTLVPLSGVEGIPFVATQERVKLHAVPHVNPRKRQSACLIVVEAERSGITVLESDATGIDVLETLRTGTGGVVSGFGFIERGSIAVAAVNQARGNIGFYAWKVSLCPEKSLRFQSCSAMPGSLWAALDSSERGSSDNCLDESGHSVMSGAVIHTKSGMMAFWPASSDALKTSVSGLRIPVVETANFQDVGIPRGQVLHSSPYFWIQGSDAVHDGIVPQLYFPRYAYLNSSDQVLGLDLCHGTLTAAIRPNLSTGKVHRTLVQTLHSGKRGAWLMFAEVISGEHAGCYHFSASSDSEAMVSPGSWWIPGRDGAFVGSRDELVVILSNSGTQMFVFDTQKLANQGAAGMIGTLQAPDGGVVTRIFRGPIARIPGPPKPKPDIDSDDSELEEEDEEALREWEDYEAKRVEVPRTFLALTARNKLCLLSSSHGYSLASSRAALPKATYQLPPSAFVVQLAWQSLVNPNGEFHSDLPGADEAAACLLSITLSDRVIFLNDRLEHVSTCLLPGDVGGAVSSLWVGPSLLVSTSNNQIVYVSIDGTSYHACSTMMGPAVTLLAATGDKLMYVYRTSGSIEGGIEPADRAWEPVPMMMVGWAQLAAKSILPGGMERARKSLLSLISSYGATKIPAGVLDVLAAHGFADLAAAAATCSELPMISDMRRKMFEAASGDWDPVVSAMLAEYEDSEYYPDHPEEHSLLFQKMVVLARSAELHGQFKHARLLFEAAGAWRELLALCLFQGDFDALQRYGSRGGRRAELIASHLLAVNEDAFRRSVATNNPRYGGRPFVEDYAIGGKEMMVKNMTDMTERPTTPDGPDEIVTNGQNIVEPAPSDRLPFMQATLELNENSLAMGRVDVRAKSSLLPAGQVEGPREDRPNENQSKKPDEGSSDDEDGADPIGRVDRTKLAPYLGVAGATIKPGCIIADEVVTAVSEGEHPEEANDLDEIDFDDFADGEDSDLGAVQRVITAVSPGSVSDTATETSRGDSVSTRDVMMKTRRQQEETRAAFMASKKLIDDEFYSSDDDSSVMGGTVGQHSASSFAAMTSSKLIFRIKSKEEAEEDSAAVAKEDHASLSVAVQKIQGLNLGGSGKQSAAGGQPRTFPMKSNEAAAAPIPEDLFVANDSQQGQQEPMRASQPPAVPQSDLLSGWDDFEAMFSDTAEQKTVDVANSKASSEAGVAELGVAANASPALETQPTTASNAPFAVPDASRQHYIKGMAYFNVSGSSSPSWNKASRELAKAFTASSPTGHEPFRRRCANEYAAACLMHEASKSKKSATAARLARYAAALDTDTKMQLATQMAAAEMNVKAGNRRWAGELLNTMLIEIDSMDLGDSVDMKRLGELLSSCGGGFASSDKSIPPDEDVETTRLIIEVSASIQEISSVMKELTS